MLARMSDEETPRRVLVLIPTYNEAGNIEPIVRRLRSAVPGATLIVLDDNSPDGTGAVADELAMHDEAVRVVHRARKAGLGAAYLDGFAIGIREGFDVIVEIDADGSHPPETLPALLDRLAVGDVELVIGSRWVPGGRVVNWPRRRELLSRMANRYTRVALGMPVHDATSGFRAYDASALRDVDLRSVASEGYGFQVEMSYRIVSAGHSVAEVPIVFHERERGASKMSAAIIIEAMGKVTMWGFRRLLDRNSARNRPRRRPD